MNPDNESLRELEALLRSSARPVGWHPRYTRVCPHCEQWIGSDHPFADHTCQDCGGDYRKPHRYARLRPWLVCAPALIGIPILLATIDATGKSEWPAVFLCAGIVFLCWTCSIVNTQLPRWRKDDGSDSWYKS